MNLVRGGDESRDPADRDVDYLLGNLAQLVIQMESALPRLEAQVARLERIAEHHGGGDGGAS